MPKPPKGNLELIVFPSCVESVVLLIFVGLSDSISISNNFKYSQTSLEINSPQTLCFGKLFFSKRVTEKPCFSK